MNTIEFYFDFEGQLLVHSYDRRDFFFLLSILFSRKNEKNIENHLNRILFSNSEKTSINPSVFDVYPKKQHLFHF